MIAYNSPLIFDQPVSTISADWLIMVLIKAQNITKQYTPDFKALDNVSLEIVKAWMLRESIDILPALHIIIFKKLCI